MAAHAIDNTLPGARPDKITAPFVVWMAAVLAGPLFGGLWLYHNAKNLGCRDLKRQGMVLLAGFLFCAPLLALIDMIKDSFEDGSVERLGNRMLMNLAILTMIVVSGYCYTRQVKLFQLHAAELGKKPLGLGKAVLFVLAAWVVTIILLATVTPLGEAMGGVALFLN